MREPPKLADAEIAAVLQAHYGLAIAALTFLPLGNDSASSVYRVQTTDGITYFLKARAGRGFSVPSLAVPHYLHNQGIPHILAPLPTSSGMLWVILNDFALSLYPFVDGSSGADIGMSEQHWRAFGSTMRQVHTTQLPPDLERIIPREAFVPKQRNLITELETAIVARTPTSVAQRELAAFWHTRRDDIRGLVERADELGRRLRQLSAPLVLCHADMHTWNILLDTIQQLWIVDWDETILARKERDLMFVVGGIGAGLVSPHDTNSFLQGYGDATIDPLALTYYRYAWAVQDLAAYGEQVFFLPDQSEDARREGVHGFISQFEPGNMVAIARASDNTIASLATDTKFV